MRMECGIEKRKIAEKCVIISLNYLEVFQLLFLKNNKDYGSVMDHMCHLDGN